MDMSTDTRNTNDAEVDPDASQRLAVDNPSL